MILLVFLVLFNNYIIIIGKGAYDVYPDFTKDDVNYQLVCCLIYAATHLTDNLTTNVPAETSENLNSSNSRKSTDSNAGNSTKPSSGRLMSGGGELTKKAGTGGGPKSHQHEQLDNLFKLVEEQFRFSLKKNLRMQFQADHWRYIVMQHERNQKLYNHG